MCRARRPDPAGRRDPLLYRLRRAEDGSGGLEVKLTIARRQLAGDLGDWFSGWRCESSPGCWRPGGSRPGGRGASVASRGFRSCEQAVDAGVAALAGTCVSQDGRRRMR